MWGLQLRFTDQGLRFHNLGQFRGSGLLKVESLQGLGSLDLHQGLRVRENIPQRPILIRLLSSTRLHPFALCIVRYLLRY